MLVIENCLSVTYSAVPTEVDSYHSLFPLEPLPPPNRIQKSSNFGYITSCYKAVNSKDDLPYCLRRIHGKEDWFLLSGLYYSSEDYPYAAINSAVFIIHV